MISQHDRKRKVSSASEPSSKNTKQSEEDVSSLHLHVHLYLLFKIC